MSVHQNIKRVTTHVLHEMKLRGEKIAMLTAYDYSMARIIDEANIDIIFIDSRFTRDTTFSGIFPFELTI